MKWILEVDDYISLAVDETDVAILLDGGQSFREHPCTAVLCRDGNLSRVHIIVTALVFGAEDGQRIIAGRSCPIQFNVLDGHFAGGGIFNGYFSVVSPDGHQFVIEQEPVVRDFLGNGSTGVAACENGCGGKCRENKACFHKAN